MKIKKIIFLSIFLFVFSGILFSNVYAENNPYSLTLNSDKSRYALSETIHITGTIDFSNSNKFQEAIMVSVFNSNSNHLGHQTAVLIKNGNFDLDVIIDPQINRLLFFDEYGDSVGYHFSKDNQYTIKAQYGDSFVEKNISIFTPKNVNTNISEKTSEIIDISTWFLVIIPIIAGIIVIYISYQKSSLKKARIDPKKRITEADLRNNFSKLSWKDAEDLVGELFKEKGYKIEVGVLSESGEQKRSGDFGIDVRAKNSNESIGIQVKHWTDNVKSEDVAKTIGYADPFDKVIIISTKSDFTTQTYTAKNEGQFKKAELWNTDKFKDEIRTHILIEKQ